MKKGEKVRGSLSPFRWIEGRERGEESEGERECTLEPRTKHVFAPRNSTSSAAAAPVAVVKGRGGKERRTHDKVMEKTAKAAAASIAAAVFGVVAAAVAVSRTSLAGVAPPRPLPMMNGFERWRERKKTPAPGCVDPPRADPRSRRGTL